MAKGQCTQVEVQSPKSKVCKYNFCIRDLPREGRVSASELFCCQRLLILIHLGFYLCPPLIVAIYVFVPQLLCLPGTQSPIYLTLLKLTLCQHPLSFFLSLFLNPVFQNLASIRTADPGRSIGWVNFAMCLQVSAQKLF